MKQTISEKISADIRSYMAASVDHGTSRTSKVQGYSSGGKTGTAEKLPRGNGKYLVSFIGFAPVDDPALVIYVVVDEPKVDDQASSTYAQYIAQGILSEALPYLNVQPDEAEDGEVPTTELWELFKGISDSATGTGADGQKRQFPMRMYQVRRKMSRRTVIPKIITICRAKVLPTRRPVWNR